MQGKKIGYKRVSTVDQNPERQLANVELDKVFLDRCSGKNKEREQLSLLRNFVREGDHVYVQEMDRLARNVQDLLELVREFIAQNVTVHFVKESLVFDSNTSSMGYLMLQLMGSIAEFERNHTIERIREGVKIAKEKGQYTGRQPVLNQETFNLMKIKLNDGFDKPTIAKHLGIAVSTIYKYLRDEKEDRIEWKKDKKPKFKT